MNLDLVLNSIGGDENGCSHNVSGKRKSYLIIRKHGDKLRILRRSSKPGEMIRENTMSDSNKESGEDEDIVYGDISIGPEDVTVDLDLINPECNVFHEEHFSDFTDDSDMDFNSDTCLSDFDTTTAAIKTSTVCEVCGLKFKSSNGLASHRKWKHTNIVKHECEFCGKSFRDSFCLKRHLHRIHTKDGGIRENYRSLQCSLCDFKATEGTVVSKHYNKVHGYDTSEKKIRFSSVEEFEKWKKEIEGETKSRFVKLRGSRTNRNGTTVIVYNCHRSGYYNSLVKGYRQRKMKSNGSNKINGFCPATMSCILYEGHVIVTYMPVHVGHDLDVNKLSLTNDEKDYIANQLSSKVPMEQILEDLNKRSDPSEMKRINLTTRKDFYNIIQKYKLKGAVYSQSKSEWRKLHSWVEETKNADNIIRFYKPHGKLIEQYSEFKSEDFCLILATDQQLDMLKNYSNNCLCVDNVSKVNINDFELYTIIVLDDFRESYPCAFIFSSRVDDNALRVYFKIIKSFINCELYPRHFVSDYANSIYNAWTSTFSAKPFRNLFSSLNIESEWRRSLIKIKIKGKQTQVFDQVKKLLYIRNFQEFEDEASNVVRLLSLDFDTRVYSNYLLKFVMNSHPWACCYRLNAEINNCLNVKDFHGIIEYYQIKGKKVKSLCKTAKALIKYVTNKFVRRSDVSYSMLAEKKINSIISRHKMSSELLDPIIEISKNGWNIMMNGDITGTKHFVYRDDLECPCSLVCPECKVCTHAYSCTCPDATIELNMCQHIHLIVTCLQNNSLIDVSSEVLEVEVVNSDSLDYKFNDSSSDLTSGVKMSHNGIEPSHIDIMCQNDEKSNLKCQGYPFVERSEDVCEAEEGLIEVLPQHADTQQNLSDEIVKIKQEDNKDDETIAGSSLRSYYSQGELMFENEVIIKDELDDEMEETDQFALEVVLES